MEAGVSGAKDDADEQLLPAQEFEQFSHQRESLVVVGFDGVNQFFALTGEQQLTKFSEFALHVVEKLTFEGPHGVKLIIRTLDGFSDEGIPRKAGNELEQFASEFGYQFAVVRTLSAEIFPYLGDRFGFRQSPARCGLDVLQLPRQDLLRESVVPPKVVFVQGQRKIALLRHFDDEVFRN